MRGMPREIEGCYGKRLVLMWSEEGKVKMVVSPDMTVLREKMGWPEKMGRQEKMVSPEVLVTSATSNVPARTRFIG